MLTLWCDAGVANRTLVCIATRADDNFQPTLT